MKDITMYVYYRCSTCRKAIKFMDESGIKYVLKDLVGNDKDIKRETPTKEELTEFANYLVANNKNGIKALFNTSGLSYKALNLAKTFNTYTFDQLIDMLANDPKLIKRPTFVLKEDGKIQKVICGFKEDEILDNLL